MLAEINKNQYQEIAAELAQKTGQSAAAEAINTSISHRCFIYTNTNNETQACAILYFPTVKYQNEKCCFFGNFICLENRSVFNDFLAELERIAVTTKAQHFIGPMNGSTWNSYRWSITGGTALFPGDVVNPDFYPSWLQEMGFKVISHYQTSRDKNIVYDTEATARKSTRLSSLDWRIRPLDSNQMTEELTQIYQLSCIAFANNFLYSAISESDFITKYSAWLRAIPADMILLAEDVGGKLLGFLLAYPDGKKGVVIKTVARRPEDKYRGIGLMLCQKLYDSLPEESYDYVLHALMQKSNHSIKTSAVLSGIEVREYALFGKELS